jgi:hypothetical protein
MPIYRVYLEDGGCIKSEGEELPNDDAARVLTERMAWEMTKNSLPPANLYLLARDESGREVHEAYLAEWASPTAKPPP